MTDPQVTQLFLAARQHLDRGDLRRAEALARKVLERHRKHGDAIALLGMIAHRRSDFDGAIDLYRKAIAIDARHAGYRLLLGETYLLQARLGEAMACFERARKLRPEMTDAAVGCAEVLHRQGETERACKLIAPLVTAGPVSAKLAVLQTRLLRASGDHAAAAEFAEAQLARSEIKGPRRRELLFLLAGARDRLGDVDAAFAAYEAANAIGKRPYDDAAVTRAFDAMIDAFGADVRPTLPRSDERPDWPVYIVGLPRCGSTLIEQIIDVHPRVKGTGEIRDLADAVESMVGGPAAVIDRSVITGLSPETIQTTARSYLERFHRRGPRAARVVDKNLANYRNLGLLSLLVPSARVIHATREPIEHCFSCFINNLSPIHLRYASDLAWMAAYYRQYRRLMAFWWSELDLRVLDVPYEALVADPETWARRIVAFLDLEWDDACLRFHESARRVSTISAEQVRKPIYTSALGRAERYADHLEPLRAALGELCDAG